MAGREPPLVLDPSHELRFNGPFSDISTAYLSLRNSTNRPICFKVKTTAPRHYCVRPNTGILEPYTSTSVEVMLQPYRFDPKEKIKHKFMIQYMFVPDYDFETYEELWRYAPSEELMDSKLKCVFVLPEGVHRTISTESRGTYETADHFKDNPEDLNRISGEVKRLKSEISSLKNENNRLKNDGRRLKKVTDNNAPGLDDHSAMTISMEAFYQLICLAAMMCLGILIGKYLL